MGEDVFKILLSISTYDFPVSRMTRAEIKEK